MAPQLENDRRCGDMTLRARAVTVKYDVGRQCGSGDAGKYAMGLAWRLTFKAI
jgi:hypothetical protein